MATALATAGPRRTPRMTARLIAWEGAFGERTNEQKMIKQYTAHLRESITEALGGSGWRYERFKTYKTPGEANFKLELHFVHPDPPDSPLASDQLLCLCRRLLTSELATHLRSLNPGAVFTLGPSREGVQTAIDKKFVRCFSAGIVSRYCAGRKLSQDMEAERDSFVRRNSIKYMHRPMLGVITAASMVIECDSRIDEIAGHLENFNTLAFNRGVIRAGAMAYSQATGGEVAGLEDVAMALKMAIAKTVGLMRVAKHFAPDIKLAIEAKMLVLHDQVIASRLSLASDAYLRESVRAMEALRTLEKLEERSADDLAVTINAFGNLMQTTMPLFQTTLAITDAEFKDIVPTIAAAGVGLATAVTAGGLVYFGTAALLGPVGLFGAAAGVITAAFGTKAARGGAAWNKKKQTNPSVTLLAIEKTIEECAAYLLCLLVLAAEEEGGDDAAFLKSVQLLSAEVASREALKPSYVRAYFKTVTKKLEKDMADLKSGLEEVTSEAAARRLSGTSPTLAITEG